MRNLSLERVVALLCALAFIAGFGLAWFVSHDRTFWLLVSNLCWRLQ